MFCSFVLFCSVLFHTCTRVLLFLSAGINCHTSLSAADDITIDFRVYQTHFDTDTGPWYYNWTNCESVDTAMATAAVGPMAVEATGCKATVSGDKAQYFTFSQTLSVTGDSAAPPCGGTYTGTVSSSQGRVEKSKTYKKAPAHSEESDCIVWSHD